METLPQECPLGFVRHITRAPALHGFSETPQEPAFSSLSKAFLSSPLVGRTATELMELGADGAVGTYPPYTQLDTLK
jgi:hypothetical protein